MASSPAFDMCVQAKCVQLLPRENKALFFAFIFTKILINYWINKQPPLFICFPWSSTIKYATTTWMWCNFYLSLSRFRAGDCPLVRAWWEMGGDALAGLEEEVVEEVLVVVRSKPPPPTHVPVPVPLPLCLMPFSSMLWPPPPVTSFHNCWSSAGLKPPAAKKEGKWTSSSEEGSKVGQVLTSFKSLDLLTL